MARNKGTFNFAANFQVKMQDLLDPRGGVETKAELINKETFPYDGDTIYMKEGMLVTVSQTHEVYMLISLANILATDYSGWKQVDAGAASQVEVIDNLTSENATKALSANQGRLLKELIDEISQKVTSIYTPKGSVESFDKLPTEDLKVGDVYNVVAANGNYPAGTNYAWTGTEWDALGGNIDLSNYYNKSEVDAAILVETNRATAEEERLEGLITANTTLGNEAKGLAQENKTQLESATKSIGEINTTLGEVATDLEELTEKNTEQDNRLKALEELVTGGDTGEGGETDQTLLQKVNANTLAISNLQSTVGDTNSGLVKAVNTLNGNAETEGSVDYKIAQAFKWVEVE